LGKKVLHVTAVDERGAVVERKRLRRTRMQSYLTRLPQGCSVAMEACASAHHWARFAGRLGHDVLLMSPQYVAPYVKSNKNDVNDADAIAEASSRPGMRYVGVKSVQRQHVQQVHRARQLAVKERTAHCNQLHGFLLEYGIEAPKGVGALRRRLAEVLEDADNELCVEARALLWNLGEELRRLDKRVKEFDTQVERISREIPACQRLETIPGIGPLTSTALVAAVGDAAEFRNGRELAAWLGIVPRQHSTGGRPRLLGISKRGDRYLRYLLIHGARSALLAAGRRPDQRSRWAVEVEKRRGRNIAAVALANKNARTAWAVLTREASFDANYPPKAA
jgi:transposase